MLKGLVESLVKWSEKAVANRDRKNVTQELDRLEGFYTDIQKASRNERAPGAFATVNGEKKFLSWEKIEKLNGETQAKIHAAQDYLGIKRTKFSDGYLKDVYCKDFDFVYE